ncbi:MAG: hypothetical protein DSY92_05315 [Planctomycetota bacterium]|nr:MAG: hypothetical protein DSY92_05315 [Planctomycetota bacterium]
MPGRFPPAVQPLVRCDDDLEVPEPSVHWKPALYPPLTALFAADMPRAWFDHGDSRPTRGTRRCKGSRADLRCAWRQVPQELPSGSG